MIPNILQTLKLKKNQDQPEMDGILPKPLDRAIEIISTAQAKIDAWRKENSMTSLSKSGSTYLSYKRRPHKVRNTKSAYEVEE